MRAHFCESRQNCGAGNDAQGMEYSLPLLGVLSWELTCRDLGFGGLSGVSGAEWPLGKQAELCGEKRDTDYGMQFTTAGGASREL